MSDYPQHDKLARMQSALDAIMRFTDWLEAIGLLIMDSSVTAPDRTQPCEAFVRPASTLVAEYFGYYFGLDMPRLASEREAMNAVLEQIAELRDSCHTSPER